MATTAGLRYTLNSSSPPVPSSDTDVGTASPDAIDYVLDTPLCQLRSFPADTLRRIRSDLDVAFDVRHRMAKRALGQERLDDRAKAHKTYQNAYKKMQKAMRVGRKLRETALHDLRRMRDEARLRGDDKRARELDAAMEPAGLYFLQMRENPRVYKVGCARHVSIAKRIADYTDMRRPKRTVWTRAIRNTDVIPKAEAALIRVLNADARAVRKFGREWFEFACHEDALDATLQFDKELEGLRLDL